MSASRVPSLVTAALVVLVVGGGYSWFRASHHRVEEQRIVGYAGPARVNPHYLLEAFLSESGYKTEPMYESPQGPPDPSLLFWLSAAPLEAWVLPWVAEGSHVVVADDPFVPDLELTDGGQQAADSWPLRGLVKRQYAYGEGCVTVVFSRGALANPVFPEPPRPEQLLSALECTAWLSRATLYAPPTMPWFGWTVAQRGWPVLVALVVALGLWLWHAARPFGPRLPSPPLARRSMLEHLAAVGHLAVRTRSVDGLCAATRGELVKRLSARVPGAQAVEGQALVERVAKTTGLDASVVRTALVDPATREPSRWVAIARAQQQLWRL